MSNFLDLLNDVLLEQNKDIKYLEKQGILPERAFYQYKDYTPYLSTIIKIANCLKISIDYLADRRSENNFVPYKLLQTNFYYNLLAILKDRKISQSKFSKDLLLDSQISHTGNKANGQSLKL